MREVCIPVEGDGGRVVASRPNNLVMIFESHLRYHWNNAKTGGEVQNACQSHAIKCQNR